MLPKVATHILHTTSRAAASIQHQTYTIRNVLQLQSSSGPSSGSANLAPWNNTGSSHWGNNGPGPGGAKYHAGSRFSNGYIGAARAVTQANAIASNDGSFTHSEEPEEAPRRVFIPSTKRTRIRSHSLSIPVQDRSERGEKLGVLKTVQLHARSRHAFAFTSSPENTATLELQHSVNDTDPRPILARRNSTSAPLISSDDFDATLSSPAPQTFIRRNSTSTSSATLVDAFDSLPPPHSPNSVAPSLLTDPSVPQTITPPVQEQITESDAFLRLKEAHDSGNAEVVAEAVHQFRQSTVKPSVREYNMAIKALCATRLPGDHLQVILDTYDDMLKHSLLPNAFTYSTLIVALTDRDLEVHKTIHGLEMRIKHHLFTRNPEDHHDETDRKRIETLRVEDNFASAMSLFEALVATNQIQSCPFMVYTNLLRSAAFHASITSAIHIFAQIEKRPDLRPSIKVYTYLIQTYANAGEINGAEEVFNEFLNASKRGAVEWAHRWDPDSGQRSLLLLWNQMTEAYFRCGMPDKAIGLVDQMMNTTAGTKLKPTDIPPTASSTFTTVLSGFCQMGDVATALIWFDRLLQQAQEVQNPFEMTGVAMKPDGAAWTVMLDALSREGMVDDLNRLFLIRVQLDQEATKEHQEHQAIKPIERIILFNVNMARIRDLTPGQAADALKFLTQHTISHPHILPIQGPTMAWEIMETYISMGMYEAAILILVNYVGTQIRENLEYPRNHSARTIDVLQNMQLAFTRRLYERTQGDVPFAVVLQLARVADMVKAMQQEEYTPLFLQSYALSKNAGTLPINEMVQRDWELILYAAIEVETAAVEGRPVHRQISQYAFEGVFPLLQDLSRYGVAFDQMHANLIKRTIELISAQKGVSDLKTIFRELGPNFQSVLDDFERQVPASPRQALVDSSFGNSQLVEQPSAEPPFQLVIDPHQTKFIEEVLQRNTSSRRAVLQAFGRFIDGVNKGAAPSPSTIGRLIQSLGRLGEMEYVAQAYNVAQTVLQLLELNKSWQADAWFMIEDSMIIAFAHHGDVNSAHVHRMRILEEGGAPTADAYGALILNVKDTTDDTSNAMTLFQESQARGVNPNQYLYNNIISKLAKARKADYALELFQQMKTNRVSPSSITYGAVIGACARVGDVQSAEMLFAEMVGAPNFKPRVPPYNTMMQMYTTTKPNRERALYFYQELIKANVSPTAHTYKLLMDAYGVIEPVDITSMEQVFQSLQEDPNVDIQGNHFSTLINAYGCVQKDLNKAIEIFDSIPSYLRAQPIDAVVFESMINVLVAHRRTDLIPEYISKMNAAGVHMTAYIANFLIKGYAMVGDLVHARSIFESLVDPPEGMAAPNNHTPHESGSSPVINHMEPVYREPSTWEAMIRAELGSGNRQEALALLGRLKARQYPEAVYNRISGIMVDHSVILS